MTTMQILEMAAVDLFDVVMGVESTLANPRPIAGEQRPEPLIVGYRSDGTPVRGCPPAALDAWRS